MKYEYQTFRRNLQSHDRPGKVDWLNELGRDGWQAISIEGLWDSPTTLTPHNVFWGFEVIAMRQSESPKTPDVLPYYHQLFTWTHQGVAYAALHETPEDGLKALRQLGIGSFTQQRVRLLR